MPPTPQGWTTLHILGTPVRFLATDSESAVRRHLGAGFGRLRCHPPLLAYEVPPDPRGGRRDGHWYAESAMLGTDGEVAASRGSCSPPCRTTQGIGSIGANVCVARWCSERRGRTGAAFDYRECWFRAWKKRLRGAIREPGRYVGALVGSRGRVRSRDAGTNRASGVACWRPQHHEKPE